MKGGNIMIFFMSGKDAFPYAFSQFTDTVYRVAVHNSARPADAEDITQAVFVKLLESEKHFRGEEHLKAWLIRVTINLCRDELRKNSKIVLASLLCRITRRRKRILSLKRSERCPKTIATQFTFTITRAIPPRKSAKFSTQSRTPSFHGSAVAELC